MSDSPPRGTQQSDDRSNDPAGGEPHAARSGPAGSTPQRRRKPRWGRRIAAGLCLLVLLVVGAAAAVPYLLGVAAVRDFALQQVNARIPGSIGFESAGLSWFSACEIRGLSIRDPQKREVIAADRIGLDGGLARLAQSLMNFGRVTLDAPHVTLYLDEHNRVTLSDAFAPPSGDGGQAASSSGGALPEPRGEVVLKNAIVRVVRPGGETIEVSSLEGRLALNSLNEITAALSAALADGGQADIEADVRDLFGGGSLQADRARGKVRLVSKQAVALGPVSGFFSPTARVDGDTAFDVSATWDESGMRGEYNVALAGLRTPPAAGGDAIKPLDVELKGRAAYAGRKLTADAAVSSAAGQLRADLQFDNSKPPPPITADRLLSALLTGEQIDLPQLKLTGEGRVDLAKLQEAVPGLLQAGPNRRITGGTLEIGKLAFEGGATPLASGSMELRDLTGQSDGRAIRAEPVSCTFDARIAPGKGLTLQSTELKSAFAQVAASGDPTELKATFAGNLSRLKQELGAFLGDAAFELNGNLSGSLLVARPGTDRVNVTLDLNGEQVRYAADGRQIDLPKATVRHAGHVTLANQKAQRWVVEKLDADLGGELVAQAAGWFDVAGGGYHADMTATRLELAALARHAAAMGVEALRGFGGSLSGTLSVEQSAAGKPIATTGNLTGRGLSLDGQALSDRDARFDWSGVQIAPEAGLIEVASARLDSAVAGLTASNVRVNTGATVTLNGDLDANADLAGVLRTAGRLGGWKDIPQLTGRLTWKSNCAAAGQSVTLTGGGAIEQFTAGVGERTVREEHVQFDYDVKLDNQQKRVGLQKLRLASGPLTADASGSIDQFDSACVMNITGRYDAKWESLTTILHSFVPSLVGVVDIRGVSSAPFQIAGPASQAGAKPAFRGVVGGLEANWASGSVLEIPLGAAKLTPSLKDGQLQIAGGPIPVSDGSIELGGMIDFQPGEPTLRVPGSLKLLNKIVITRQLADALLSRINPIFMHMLAAEGKVSMSLKDWIMPLGDSIKRTGSGTGRLDLSRMVVQPEGLLKELLLLAAPPAGQADSKNSRQGARQPADSDSGTAARQAARREARQYTVQASAVDFELKDGRIRYNNFALKFPDNFELVFRGSVGFDDSLDLWVGLPVRPELLARLGVRGPVVEYARLLEDVRIEVPIVGTRQNPQLDFAKVDVEKLMAGVLKKAPQKALEEAVKQSPEKAVDDLLRGLTGEKEAKPAEKPPARKRPPPANERKRRK